MSEKEENIKGLDKKGGSEIKNGKLRKIYLKKKIIDKKRGYRRNKMLECIDKGLNGKKRGEKIGRKDMREVREKRRNVIDVRKMKKDECI